MTKGSVFTGWTYGREIPGMMRFPSKKQPSKRGRYTAHILPPSGANRAALHRRLAYPGAAARASRRRTNHRATDARNAQFCMMRWARGFILRKQFFIELFAGAQTCVDNFDLRFGASGQPD